MRQHKLHCVGIDRQAKRHIFHDGLCKKTKGHIDTSQLIGESSSQGPMGDRRLSYSS